MIEYKEFIMCNQCGKPIVDTLGEDSGVIIHGNIYKIDPRDITDRDIVGDYNFPENKIITDESDVQETAYHTKCLALICE